MSGIAISSKSLGHPEGKGGFQAWMIWGAAALFYLFEFFVRVAPSVMEPELQKTFHLSAGALGGALGVYYYIYAPMQLVVGGFLDRFGARGILVPATLLCSLGCFIEIAGNTSAYLMIGRFFQGFGSSFAFVGAMYLATRWFPRSRLALLSGLSTALGMLGAIAANGGIARVVQKAGWEVTIRDAGILGIVVALILYFIIPGRQPTPSTLPTEKKQTPSSQISILSSLRIVLANPQTWLVGIIGTALYMPLSVLGALWGVEYVVTITGESKEAASWSISMLYVGWMFGGPAAGWLSDYLGKRKLFLFASSILTLLTSALLMMVESISLTQMNGLMLGIGLVSSVQVVSFVCAVEHNPHEVSGTAIASTNMIIMLLGGIAQPLVGMILDSCGGINLAGHYSAHSYRIAMVVVPASAALGLIASWFLRESYSKAEEPAEVDYRG